MTSEEPNRQLPFLPGMTFQDPTKTKFHKSQAFKMEEDGRRTCDDLRPGIGGEPINEEQRRAFEANKKATTTADLFETRRKSSTSTTTTTLTTAAEYIPSWSELENGVLRFEAYCREEAPSTDFKYRIRRVLLTFWLSDDSISLAALDHATGKYQGSLLKRHRVPRSGGPQGQHITAEMLNVGEIIEMYSRKYTLISCDEATAKLLVSLGTTPKKAMDLPPDPSAIVVAKKNQVPSLAGAQDRVPGKRRDPLKQYIDNEKKVLQWICTWDDRASMHGELRKFRLHYFLADDTIEVLEDKDAAHERGVPATFANRQALPQGFPAPESISIGSTVMFNSREFLVCDMDPFTRKWFTEKTGTTEFTPIEIDHETEEQIVGTRRSAAVSEEEAARPTKGAVKRKLDNQGKALAFVAKFAQEDQVRQKSSIEAERSFSVTFKLSDETIVVIEAAQHGAPGGKFFESSERVRKPDGKAFYGPRDFFIGAKIVISGRTFQLLSASEFALKWMEANPESWSQSDLDSIIKKIVTTFSAPADAMEKLKTKLASAGKDGMITSDVLQEALKPVNLSEQEFLTLKRRFELITGSGNIHYPSMLSQMATSTTTH